MGCPTEVIIGDNLVFSVATHDPNTGVLTDADAVPAYRIYEDETPAPILTGNMAKLDDADTTGFYTESIACTAVSGFEDGKSYTIYIVATVDGDQGGITYGFKAVADTMTGILSDTNLLVAFINNKKYLAKDGTTWYLHIRNAGDDDDILKKELQDKDGNDITDVAAGVLAKELASSV